MTARVAIIGGGISGLAAAWELRQSFPDINVSVWEAGPAAGGVLQTDHRDGFLIERAADMFTTADPWALELCRELGIADELIGTNASLRGALVVRNGRLYAVPAGFTLMATSRLWPILNTPILSWRGKLRLAAEPFIPTRHDTTDESLADFVTRRLGTEAYTRLVQPLVGGIYVADGARLSINATLPRFPDLERQHGSLFRGMRREARVAAQRADRVPPADRGARYGMFVAPREGMGRFIEALCAAISPDRIHCNSAVTSIAAGLHGGWRLTWAGGRSELFEAVVLAVPSHVAADLLSPMDVELAAGLREIEYASSAVVISAYPRSQWRTPARAFGVVVPLVERRRILACSFASHKFDGRAPQDWVLVRTFVGGACQADLLRSDDDALQRLVREELDSLIGLEGEPAWELVRRWPNSMPQYHLGHLARVERIEQRVASHRGLAVAGNAYRGVGIPHCIRSGRAAARRAIGSIAQ